MRRKYELSPLEKMIFDIMLEADSPLNYEKIINMMPEQREWNDKSVYSALTNMRKNGLIEVAGKIKVARTRAILLRPTMSKDEFYQAAYSEYFEKMQHNSLDCILSAISSCRDGRTREVVDEVEAWLQSHRELLGESKED